MTDVGGGLQVSLVRGLREVLVKEELQVIKFFYVGDIFREGVVVRKAKLDEVLE